MSALLRRHAPFPVWPLLSPSTGSGVGSGATGPSLSSLIRGAVSSALRYGFGRSSFEKPNRWLFVRFADHSSPPPAFLPSPGSAGSPQRLASVRAWTSRAHHPAAYRCRDRSSAVPATFIRFMTPCSRAGDGEYYAGGFRGVDKDSLPMAVPGAISDFGAFLSTVWGASTGTAEIFCGGLAENPRR